MVEEQTQQVNDDDVHDKMILSAKAAKIIGQVEAMVDAFREEGYDLAGAAAALLDRVASFTGELAQQSPVGYQLGAIPQMAEGESEG